MADMEIDDYIYFFVNSLDNALSPECSTVNCLKAAISYLEKLAGANRENYILLLSRENYILIHDAEKDLNVQTFRSYVMVNNFFERDPVPDLAKKIFTKTKEGDYEFNTEEAKRILKNEQENQQHKLDHYWDIKQKALDLQQVMLTYHIKPQAIKIALMKELLDKISGAKLNIRKFMQIIDREVL